MEPIPPSEDNNLDRLNVVGTALVSIFLFFLREKGKCQIKGNLPYGKGSC